MSSKFLTNEHKRDLEDGTTVTYGTTNENDSTVISIMVRGKMRPVEQQKDYINESKELKESTLKMGNRVLGACNWTQKHYIFTCDFTERGITHNKPFRFKYRIYIKPLEKRPIEYYRQSILNMVHTINNSIIQTANRLGFEFVKEQGAQ